MLLQHLLNHTYIVLFQFAEKHVDAFVVGYCQLFNTFSASTIVGFNNNSIFVFNKLCKLLLGNCRKIKPFPAYKFRKSAVKRAFIVKILVILRVVQHLHQRVIHTAGNISRPLFRSQVVKLTEQIVVKARAITQSTADNICQHSGPVSPGDTVDDPNCTEHLAIVHPERSAQDIAQLAH